MNLQKKANHKGLVCPRLGSVFLGWRSTKGFVIVDRFCRVIFSTSFERLSCSDNEMFTPIIRYDQADNYDQVSRWERRWYALIWECDWTKLPGGYWEADAEKCSYEKWQGGREIVAGKAILDIATSNKAGRLITSWKYLTYPHICSRLMWGVLTGENEWYSEQHTEICK